METSSLDSKENFMQIDGNVDMFQSSIPSGVNGQPFDISNAVSEGLMLDDSMKINFIHHRKPEPYFQFPGKIYRNKCMKTGFMRNYCRMEWLELFDFAAYSRHQDGLYCLACVLFPLTRSSSRPKHMVIQPGINWKHAKADLKKHGSLPYHQACYAEMQAFLATMPIDY